MKLEYWEAFIQAYQRVCSLLDQCLLAEGLPSADRARRDAKVLGELQRDLLLVVDDLEDVLGKEYGTRQLEELVRPFIYLVDEKVLRRLSEHEQLDWELLQHERFQEDAGGDLFYELADRKLANPDTPPLIFEVLYFCLMAGFGGRHQGNEVRLREYRERLSERIPQPRPVERPAAAPADPEELSRIYEFPTRYYVVTGFFVLALPVVLWLLSN